LRAAKYRGCTARVKGSAGPAKTVKWGKSAKS
jgi:hypothetical protein